ncbi:hypothetical protein SSTU70S_04684 [Stutzerimonas stutzeri]
MLTHLAVGTSLATIVFTSINSILTHHRKGAVRWPMVLWMTGGRSAACGLPIALAGAVSFIVVGWQTPDLPEWSLGFVYLPAVLGIAATSMFFARLGARLAHRLSPRVLRLLFALLLLSVGTHFLI